ncbi:MAG: fatty-acid peroxygenase [Phormidesmis priestleyi Ana]|uniref:Fatty-acid peroxygenase n=1 Tax=Phormidesmis priestleyi Ana TaxID=1666911 RepID=A0A0P7Z0D5_9CYAN|nr:MAG: fatty-acid peroxygenase [Phormidesmis priestleyi Ana]
MVKIPSDRSLDSTVGLLRHGYQFISKKCDQLQTDIFETRLMFEKTICMRGVEAAKVFYDTDKFTRKNSAPKRIQKTLFGQGGVQGLDDKAHRHRKQMFMTLMSPARIDDLVTLTRQQWRNYAQRWTQADRIVLFTEAREVLCRAVCEWAGVPLPEAEVKLRTLQLAAMIDSSGAIGPKHWQGRLARQQAESWIKDLIESVRAGQLTASANRPSNSALLVIAEHKNLDGTLLDPQIAAVELINVLRPTLAIGRYITFAALALHEHPEIAQRIKANSLHADSPSVEWFVQEVRRFYPFFPFAAARVKQSFNWQGYTFPQGERVLLDLYGTNHDARLWENPNTFWPERFRQWDEGRFNLIPQGGGDFYLNHRCPGEWITIALMKTTVEFLTQEITYRVPEQNLTVDLSDLPALPKSRFVMSQVKSQAEGQVESQFEGQVENQIAQT